MPGYFDLNNRVALVTGASRSLGLAMAEALAEVGATVILNGPDANTLKTAADRIRDRRLKAETSAFDVTDLRATEAAIQSIVADHHRLDILIANAGTIHRAPLADWTSEEGGRHTDDRCVARSSGRERATREGLYEKLSCACIGTGKAEERSEHKACALFRGV
jgi:NADP-dependent 3-hydroxy acid dehydrogenase YdfG